MLCIIDLTFKRKIVGYIQTMELSIIGKQAEDPFLSREGMNAVSSAVK